MALPAVAGACEHGETSWCFQCWQIVDTFYGKKGKAQIRRAPARRNNRFKYIVVWNDETLESAVQHGSWTSDAAARRGARRMLGWAVR